MYASTTFIMLSVSSVFNILHLTEYITMYLLYLCQIKFYYLRTLHSPYSNIFYKWLLQVITIEDITQKFDLKVGSKRKKVDARK